MQLVDKSLVTAADDRFLLNETIRQYAAARLADSGEVAATRARHYDFFLGVARYRPSMGDTEEGYRASVSADYENIRRALQWAADQPDAACLTRLAAPLDLYWNTRKHSDGIHWLGIVVDQEEDERRRANALVRLGRLLSLTGEHDRAIAAHEEGLETLRSSGDRRSVADALLASPTSLSAADHEEVLAIAAELGDARLRAWALFFRGLSVLTTDGAEAGAMFEEALLLARQEGVDWLARQARAGLAVRSFALGEVRVAVPALEESLRELRAAGEGMMLAQMLSWVAQLRDMTGDTAGAEEALAEMRALRHEVGRIGAWAQLAEHLALAFTRVAPERAIRFLDEVDMPATGSDTRAMSLLARAMIEASAGLHAAAKSHAEEAARLGGSGSDTVNVGMPAELPLALVARSIGDTARAEGLAHSAVGWLQARRTPAHVRVAAVIVLATLWARRDRAEDAVRVYAGVAAAAEQVGMSWEYALAIGGDDGQVEACREDLGPERFEQLWAEGATMSLDDVMAYAQRGRGRRSRPVIGWESLTPTERQVADVVAAGATNREVAEQLFMSIATVKTHLNRVYAKLGVTTRSQLAAESARKPR